MTAPRGQSDDPCLRGGGAVPLLRPGDDQEPDEACTREGGRAPGPRRDLVVQEQ